MEEPSFFYYYNQALTNVNIETKTRILNLGINRGDEFGVIKNRSTEKILCCTCEELEQHLINSFTNNYSIEFKDEYRKMLEIDHIIPLATVKTEEDVYKLNHYANLQWLKKSHNRDKRAKLDYVIPKWEE